MPGSTLISYDFYWFVSVYIFQTLREIIMALPGGNMAFVMTAMTLLLSPLYKYSQYLIRYRLTHPVTLVNLLYISRS